MILDTRVLYLKSSLYIRDSTWYMVETVWVE